ncbi:MAG: ArsI/CadI family heavy metal resistance metalloenzyme [Acidimicrobiales bacterium]
MSRVQLALNVSDLDEAVRFYTRLFATEPAKLRPGYANFAIDDPPLKLVLIEGETREFGVAGALNHLGVEVGGSHDVASAQVRLSDAGLETALEEQVACCYALQDKIWVDDPNGTPWEVYTVLADADEPIRSPEVQAGPGGCCGARAGLASPADSACC